MGRPEPAGRKALLYDEDDGALFTDLASINFVKASWRLILPGVTYVLGHHSYLLRGDDLR